MEKPVIDPCEKCGLCKTSYVCSPQGQFSAKKVMGRGPKNAKIMFIGEALGPEEVIQQKHFTGSNGAKLKEALYKAGIDMEEVYLTTVCKCKPPIEEGKVRAPKNAEVKCCLPLLIEEIKTVKPKIICTMGGVALEAILDRKGLGTIRGNPYDIEFNMDDWPTAEGPVEGVLKCKVIPTYSPAYIIRWPEFKQYEVDFCKDIETVKKASEVENYVVEKKPVNYTLGNLPAFLEYIEKIKQVGLFAYDIETGGFNFLKDKIYTIALSCKVQEAVAIATKDLTPDEQELVFTKLKEVLESKTILKIGHNFKFDNKFFKTYGINVKLPLFDTMLAHFLIDENSQHGLKELAYKFTDMGGYDEDFDYDLMDEYSSEKIMGFNACDADCTLRLYYEFKDRLTKEGLTRLHDLVLIPLSQVLMETEYKGVLVDLEFLNKFEKETIARLDDIAYRINEKPEIKETERICNTTQLKEKGVPVGEPIVVAPDDKKFKKFNLNSTKDLQILLFTVAKLRPIEKTKTGYSTDAYTLKELAKKSEIASLILEYRKYKHDLSAYVEQIRRNIDENNRAHTDYMLHGSVTGRPISHEPNLQNIPRESEVKKLFISEKGCVILAADFSQIEYRMWANYSGCKQMLDDIRNGLDIHSEVACVVWPHIYKKLDVKKYLFIETGEIKSKVGGEHRTQAKGVVFGLIFGRGVKSLVEEFKLTEIQVIKIINWFFGKYPPASDWIELQKKLVRKDKQVKNLFGRLRRLPEIDSKEEIKRAEALRQAVNTPIQSGASDLCSIATIRTHNHLHRAELRSRLLLNVYDSLKYNVPIEELDKAKECITKGMTEPISGINFPLEVEFEIGPSWGDLIEYEEFEKDKEKWLREWKLL